MGDVERRTVGQRGQITIPKEFREAFGLRGGDEVVLREAHGKIVIEKAITREEVAEGYRQRARTHRALDEELAGVSAEAGDHLGDVPEWE